MKTFATVLLFLLPIIGQAQTQEDFIECMNQVLASKKIEPYLIQQEQDLGEIIITRRQNPNINRFPRAFNWALLDEADFYEAPFRVSVVDEIELDGRVNEAQRQKMMNWAFSQYEDAEDKLMVLVSFRNDIEPRMVQGQFYFEKSDEDWELLNEILNVQR